MREEKLRLVIKPCLFVPDITERENKGKRVHSVGYRRCNFRCDFCSFGKNAYSSAPEFTLESFEQKLWELMSYSKSFKFTGGEPVLNPRLPELLRLVKLYSGHTFLDTNGSFPEKMQALLDEKLVDTVGISLKGLSPSEALKNSGIKNQKLCWDNVLETLNICATDENARTILTYVACEGDFGYEDMERLYELIKDYPRLYLKINNCYLPERINYRRVGLDKGEIFAIVSRFVEAHPDFKGRTVLFADYEACLDEEKAIYF